jgi:hypothetical protein
MAVIKIVPMPGAVGDKGDEGAVGPRGQQGETGLQGPAGADALWSYNGPWQSNSSYAQGDIVTYQGQLYYVKSVTTAGTLPTDTAKFDLIASKGADGQPGTNGADALWNYTGEYSGGASYSVGDIATYEGQLWYRYGANGGNVGDTPSPGFWNLLAAKGADGSGSNTGDITFDGVKIIGAGTASGDGYGLGTIEIVPDGNITSDQYLIIDPTAPNHIHIRAGGIQDESNADILLGAEYTNVQVSDGYKSVYIRSKQQGQSMAHLNINPTQNGYLVTSDVVTATSGWTVDVNGTSYYITAVLYDNPTQGNTTIIAPGAPFVFEGVYNVFSPVSVNQWTFAPDGTFQGPAMGGLKVLGLLNAGDNDLGLYANDADIILQAASGKVDIVAPEVNIVSNAVPSSLNINTYLGAVVNSNRTSTYAAEDKVVATLGDLPTGATGTFETPDSKLVTVTNGIITSIESLT